MIHTLTIQVTPEEEADEQRLKSLIAEKLVLSTDSITGIKKLKRSIDARSRTIKIQIHAEVYVGEALLRQEYRFLLPINVLCLLRMKGCTLKRYDLHHRYLPLKRIE